MIGASRGGSATRCLDHDASLDGRQRRSCCCGCCSGGCVCCCLLCLHHALQWRECSRLRGDWTRRIVFHRGRGGGGREPRRAQGEAGRSGNCTSNRDSRERVRQRARGMRACRTLLTRSLAARSLARSCPSADVEQRVDAAARGEGKGRGEQEAAGRRRSKRRGKSDSRTLNTAQSRARREEQRRGSASRSQQLCFLRPLH